MQPLIILCWLGLALPAYATDAGVVTHLSGSLRAKLADGSFRLLGVKSAFRNGDTLITHENTYARVKFTDGAEVVLRPNSQFAITEVSYQTSVPDKDNFAVSLLKGGMRMVTGLLGKRNPNNVNVVTPTATIGIRGTHFGLLMCQGDCADITTNSGGPPDDGLHIDVADGEILVSNPTGQQALTAGQFGHVQSLTKHPSVVSRSRGIQVTIPQSISQNSADGRSVGISREDAECTVK